MVLLFQSHAVNMHAMMEVFTHQRKWTTGNFRAIKLLLQDHSLQTHAHYPTIRAAGKQRYITTDFSVNKTSVN